MPRRYRSDAWAVPPRRGRGTLRRSCRAAPGSRPAKLSTGRLHPLMVNLLRRRRVAEGTQVARPTGCSFHGHQVIESAHTERDAVQLARDRVGGERRVSRFGLDPGDPLHDVEVSEARREPEVGALLEVLDASRIERELAWPEIAETHVTRVQPGEQSRELGQVAGIGIRDDVEVLRGPDHATGVSTAARPARARTICSSAPTCSPSCSSAITCA